MGLDQRCRVGDAGAGPLAGEHSWRLEPSGIPGLDRAQVGWFGLPSKRSWGVVLRALIH